MLTRSKLCFFLPFENHVLVHSTLYHQYMSFVSKISITSWPDNHQIHVQAKKTYWYTSIYWIIQNNIVSFLKISEIIENY